MAISRFSLFVASLCVAFAFVSSSLVLPKYPPDERPGTYVEKYISDTPAGAKAAPNGYPAMILQDFDKKTGLWFTKWICARLNIDSLKGGKNFRGSDTNPKVRAFAQKLGLSTDQAGHIIAKILGFTGRENWNMVPLSHKLNNRKMKSVESQIRKIIRKQGKKIVKVYMRMLYDPSKSKTRPTRIYVLVKFGNMVCYWDMENPSS